MKPTIWHAVLSVSVLTLLAGCIGTSEGEVFSLYRNSVMNENMRLHVATFDSSDGESYNRGNCEQAKALFQAQAGVKTRFWCEKGRFKK